MNRHSDYEAINLTHESTELTPIHTMFCSLVLRHCKIKVTLFLAFSLLFDDVTATSASEIMLDHHLQITPTRTQLHLHQHLHRHLHRHLHDTYTNAAAAAADTDTDTDTDTNTDKHTDTRWYKTFCDPLSRQGKTFLRPPFKGRKHFAFPLQYG